MKKHPLVGHKIVAVHVASDKKAIRFDVEGHEPIVARADGDCCSESWVESLDTPGLLIGGTVAAVEDIDMPVSEQETEDGLIQFYGCRITTTRGACVIDYRNESNGYYGGSLEWPAEEGEYNPFYGGAYGQNVSAEEWKTIAGEAVS